MINFKLAIAAAALLFSSAAQATLVGAPVTGSLTFNAGSINYFDPANSYVPAGFGNTVGTTVTIGSGSEFGYDDTVNLITADFSEAHLLVQQTFTAGASAPWTMAFTSSAFGSLGLGSSTNFGPNLTYSLLANTITIHFAGTATTPGTTASALFDVGPATAAVPEPASWAMMLLGFAGIGATARRRRSVPASA